MIAGVDFESHFGRDNFNLRRGATVAAGVPYDPESLISGAEIAAGLDYRNSKRDWRNEAHYLAAVKGWLSTEEILVSAPRKLVIKPKPLLYCEDW